MNVTWTQLLWLSVVVMVGRVLVTIIFARYRSRQVEASTKRFGDVKLGATAAPTEVQCPICHEIYTDPTGCASCQAAFADLIREHRGLAFLYRRDGGLGDPDPSLRHSCKIRLGGHLVCAALCGAEVNINPAEDHDVTCQKCRELLIAAGHLEPAQNAV